jgi:hypothetical protein
VSRDCPTERKDRNASGGTNPQFPKKAASKLYFDARETDFGYAQQDFQELGETEFYAFDTQFTTDTETFWSKNHQQRFPPQAYCYYEQKDTSCCPVPSKIQSDNSSHSFDTIHSATDTVDIPICDPNDLS